MSNIIDINNIKNIFEAITPDNLKDIDIIQDSIDIFIDLLEEYSKVSVNINDFYNVEKTPAIKEHLTKIYLNDIYSVLEKFENDQESINRINKINDDYGYELITKDVLNNLIRSLNFEHLVTSRTFKQRKGTFGSLDYTYQLILGITNSYQTVNTNKFEITELEPFSYEVVGELQKELYDFLVFPIAHPLGYVYNYKETSFIELDDNYDITEPIGCGYIGEVTIGEFIICNDSDTVYDCGNIGEVTIGEFIICNDSDTTYDCGNIGEVTIGEFIICNDSDTTYDCGNIGEVTIGEFTICVGDTHTFGDGSTFGSYYIGN